MKRVKKIFQIQQYQQWPPKIPEEHAKLHFEELNLAIVDSDCRAKKRMHFLVLLDAFCFHHDQSEKKKKNESSVCLGTFLCKK